MRFKRHNIDNRTFFLKKNNNQKEKIKPFVSGCKYKNLTYLRNATHKTIQRYIDKNLFQKSDFYKKMYEQMREFYGHLTSPGLLYCIEIYESDKKKTLYM